ncbi:MAG: amidohydrolase family protein [Chloroflexi bacterium]|nr:amidohydrolase family protein [Chloroflexota bacterium]
MSKLKLPGLIDIHTHMREPGAIHKEDWDSGTSAALAGGFTTIFAMPNTNPAVMDNKTLNLSLKEAENKARCDFAQFIGAGSDNAEKISLLSPKTAGLKMYLDSTYGELQLGDMAQWISHFQYWPKELPIAVHAEGPTMAASILLAHLYDRPIHICHVSRKDEILVIKTAKERGLPVTCEVTPHHLFLTAEDINHLGPGRSEVRPVLASPTDRDALWENMDVIDCFATDHAPHTLQEKDGANPPPGFPGLETALPLLLTAVHEGRLSIDDLINKLHTNPRKIFNLAEQPETFIEIDPDTTWEIRADETFTRCGWTPFEGMQVRGRVFRVVLRNHEVFKDGRISAKPGTGRNLRTQST